MSDNLRIAFAGTPALAAVLLTRLLEAGRHSVTHVFTQPDRRAGRGRKPTPPPVKDSAERAGLPVSQPNTAAEMANVDALAQADVLVVAAFGRILPEKVITLPLYGSVNVHFSLLPRWRGAAPIQRAIEAGDRETGITIMQMDAGLDTGDILLQRSCPIQADDTAATLQDRLAEPGADCLLEVLDRLSTGDLIPVPQDENLATYAGKITKAEAAIEWSLPGELLERKVRAYNPAPVAHARINGQAMRIWEARWRPDSAGTAPPGTPVGYSSEGLDVATGDGLLRILKLQLPGKKVMTVDEFHSGHPNFLR